MANDPKFFEDDAIRGRQIRLRYNEYLQAKSEDGTDHIKIVKVGTQGTDHNLVIFNSIPYVEGLGRLALLSETGGGGGSGPLYHDQKTLTLANITSKSITLDNAPAVQNNVRLEIQNGPNQYPVIDFVVTGTTLSWNGLGMDGILSENDVLHAYYQF